MGLGAGSWGSWTGSWAGSWTGSWRESLARDSIHNKKYIHEPSWREVELCDFLNEWRCSSSSLISSKARGAHRRGERPGRVGVAFIKTLFSFSILFKSVRFTRAERWAVLADVIAGFSIFIHFFSKEYTHWTQGVCLLENSFVLKYQEVDKLDTKSNFQKRTFWRKRRRGAYQRRSKDNRQIAR